MADLFSPTPFKLAERADEHGPDRSHVPTHVVASRRAAGRGYTLQYLCQHVRGEPICLCDDVLMPCHSGDGYEDDDSPPGSPSGTAFESEGDNVSLAHLLLTPRHVVHYQCACGTERLPIVLAMCPHVRRLAITTSGQKDCARTVTGARAHAGGRTSGRTQVPQRGHSDSHLWGQ
jgi:hypothetical protein